MPGLAKTHSATTTLCAYEVLVGILDAVVKGRRVSVEENAVVVGEKVEVGAPKTHEIRSVPYPAFLAGPSRRRGRTRSPTASSSAAVAHACASRPRRTVVRRRSRSCAGRRLSSGDSPDVRHAAASLTISASADVKAVQRMLGHASDVMTFDTYADLFDDDLDGVSDALDKAYRASSVVKVLSPEND